MSSSETRCSFIHYFVVLATPKSAQATEVIQLGNLLADSLGVQFVTPISTTKSLTRTTTTMKTATPLTALTSTTSDATNSQAALSETASRFGVGNGNINGGDGECRWPWPQTERRATLLDSERATLATQLKQHHQQLLQVSIILCLCLYSSLSMFLKNRHC